MLSKPYSFLFALFLCLQSATAFTQHNLLLNGGFEDINTCTEYNAECGVEGWFYLLEIKAQMQSNDVVSELLGSNSLAVSFKWQGQNGLLPVIGTLLPCQLQKDSLYTFAGIFSATLNARLILQPGMAVGEKFYVPQKTFSGQMQPVAFTNIKPLPQTNFFRFEYSFIASGKEKYLTFGTFISEDTTSKLKLRGTPIITMMMDRFELRSSNSNEIVCSNYEINKKRIYNYNFRHKEMDNYLFTKGELPIQLVNADSNSITRFETPKRIAKPDTLKLGDVFFDFNKAGLKTDGIKMLESFFLPPEKNRNIDSIYIEGHTDSIGSDTKNLKLSADRSKAVQSWLTMNDIISEDQVKIHPFGKTRPVASNKTEKGRALNRRVEIIIFRKKEE